MTLLDRILGRSVSASSMNGVVEYDGLVPDGLSFRNVFESTNQTASSVRVTEQSSLGMAAVWRAVNLIAGGAASLPLHPYTTATQDGREELTRQRVTEGPAARLLDAPHRDLTPFEFWEIVYSHLLLWGNSYSLRQVLPTGREVLWPLHPSRVVAGRRAGGEKAYRVDSERDLLGDDQILHIPGFGYDGTAGMSAIQCARAGIGLAIAAEDFGGKLFGSGSLAGGILQTEQRLKPEQADALKQRWEARAGGLNNAHKIAVLDSGAKFQQLTIPPEDAQFIQTRVFQIEEVARIFGVPPHMLMSSEKSTSWGTGLEQQSLGFVTFTLRPWLIRVEQRVTSILPTGVYAKYALEGLLRGDSNQRADFYGKLWNLGAINTNEIRALEELGPIEGGDTRFRTTNAAELTTTAVEDTRSNAQKALDQALKLVTAAPSLASDPGLDVLMQQIKDALDSVEGP